MSASNKQPKPHKIARSARSAVSGQFCSSSYAAKHSKTTVLERVKRAVRVFIGDVPVCEPAPRKAKRKRGRNK